MTKCIVIGAEDKAPPKPIEFNEILCTSGDTSTAGMVPADYKFIELIALDYSPNKDLMFAYNNPEDRGHGILYFGHWNGGFVE